MIKNLEKDLRTYRHETFVTSFFATITILLIVLIICSIPSNAQEISGGENDDTYSYDSENFVNWLDVFKGIDIQKTNPTGVLNLEDNPSYVPDNTNYPGVGTYNKIPPSSYYFQSPNASMNGIFDGNTIMNVPEYFIYDGIQYQVSSYKNFYFMVWGEGAYCSLIISKSSSLMSCLDSYRKWYQPLGTDSFILYYPNGPTSNPVIKRPVEQRISGHDVDDNVNILNISYYDALVYTNASATCEMNDLKEDNGWYWIEQKYNEIELNYLKGQNGNGGSSTSESAENNLVMENADWQFTNKDYYGPYCKNTNSDKVVTSSVYPSGNIAFSFIPTDYQINHALEFNIIFSFSWDYNVNYDNKHGNDSTKPFDNTILRHKNFVANFSYYNNGTDTAYVTVPLSEFISNNNVKSWTFKEVMDKLYYNNYLFPDVLELTNKPYGTNPSVDVFEYNTFNINATAFIDLNGGNSSSGNYTEYYNPMNRQGGTSDDSGAINKNPYNNNTDVSTPGDAPGSAGNNNNIHVDGSNVNINITNTNNNTNTLNGTDNSFKNIFDTLVGSNKMDADTMQESIGSNGFAQVVKDSGAFVPKSLVTIIVTYFGIAFGILIIAFVLRMILDLL